MQQFLYCVMLEGDLSAVTVAALLLVRVPPSHAATCLFAPGAVCVATQFARPPPVATLPGESSGGERERPTFLPGPALSAGRTAANLH